MPESRAENGRTASIVSAKKMLNSKRAAADSFTESPFGASGGNTMDIIPQNLDSVRQSDNFMIG